MSWLDGLRHRLRTVLRPGAYERELQDELSFHLDLGAQQLDDDQARGRFGNRTYYAEETRAATWLRFVDVLSQDARYARRAIARSPGFTALIAITLALGIGLNAATFSLLDRLYLRQPGGVADPSGIRRIWIESSRYEGGVTRASEAMNYPMFRAIARAWGDTSRFAVKTRQGARLGGTVRGHETRLTFASANYFSLLGVRPALGRFYSADEDRLGSGAPVVVVSHRFWRNHLAGDTSIVGGTIQFGAQRYTVIGVAEASFNGVNIEPEEVWIPIGATPQGAWMNGRLFELPSMHVFQAIVRSDGREDMSAFERRATQGVRQVLREWRPHDPDTTARVLTGSIIRARGPGEPGQELVISTRLGGVAVIVLLIACANVVNLLLARAVSRRREIAVRLALGVSRGRLVRLLTTETVLLALIASAAALVAAWWGGGLLRSLLLPDIEWTDAVLHWRVVVFTVGVALACGGVAGIIPAIQYSSPRLATALKEGARDGGMHRSRLRSGLLVAQAALSVMLLVGAALFVRSLRNVQGLDIGFDASQLLFARVAYDVGQSPGEAVIGARMKEIGQRLQALPGIEAIARAGMPPMRGLSFYTFFWGPAGADSSGGLSGKFPVISAVSPEFFAAAGLRVLSGVTFGDGAAEQVVVNEAMAKMIWPRADPLGQCMYFEKRGTPCHRVVGVVETARRDKVIEDPSPQYYLPLGTEVTKSWEGSTLVIRAKPDAIALARQELTAALRREFPGSEPRIDTMMENLEPEYRPWRLGAKLFTAFGILALIVALVGVYSTMSYSVSQRTHEFGVRVALGARVGDVVSQVVGEGLRVVMFGIVMGVALALAAGRLVAALLYGVEPSDPGVMLLVSAVLLLASGVAAFVPAWRASRVEPVIALRSD